MKKMMMAVLCSFFCLAATAQDSSSNYQGGDTLNGKMKNFVTMTGGKVMVVKDGMSKQLMKDKTLKDGIVLKTDGNIIFRDGQTKRLTEGQRFYFSEPKEMDGTDKPQGKRDSTP